jgi:predicted kinase
MHPKDSQKPRRTERSGPTLQLVCGKIASGKSTLANQLAAQPDTVLLSEDKWLSSLFPGEIKDLGDYLRCSDRLKAALGDHVVALLQAGLSVVLDFPANTQRQRAWLRGLFETAGVAHKLHYLDLSDETCKERLRARNADGSHPFTTTEAQFEAITRHFLPPSAEEGFEVVRFLEPPSLMFPARPPLR